MPRFFVSAEALAGDTVELRGEDCRHIGLSLRMAVGDPVTLSDGRGQECLCRLTEISPARVVCRVEERRPGAGEMPVSLRLYPGLAKGEKMEWIVQKAVELGADAVLPFESSRSVVRLHADRAEKQTARLARIAAEAAGQCGRARLPGVFPPLSFTAALADAAAHEARILFCYEGEKNTTLRAALEEARADGVGTIALFTGSEGGFSPEEAEEAYRAGAKPVTFGARILRCETAPLFALSCAAFVFEM